MRHAETMRELRGLQQHVRELPMSVSSRSVFSRFEMVNILPTCIYSCLLSICEVRFMLYSENMSVGRDPVWLLKEGSRYSVLCGTLLQVSVARTVELKSTSVCQHLVTLVVSVWMSAMDTGASVKMDSWVAAVKLWFAHVRLIRAQKMPFVLNNLWVRKTFPRFDHGIGAGTWIDALFSEKFSRPKAEQAVHFILLFCRLDWRVFCLFCSGGYNCFCKPGFQGTECQDEINECSSNPCFNGGVCEEGINSYTCVCPPGKSICPRRQERNEKCLQLKLIVTTEFEGLPSVPHRLFWSVADCWVARPVCMRPKGRYGSLLGFSVLLDGVCSPIAPELFWECIQRRFYSWLFCNLYCFSGITGENCDIDVNECLPGTCLNGGFCFEPRLDMFECACAPGFTGLRCETNIDECSSSPCLNPLICVDGINFYTWVTMRFSHSFMPKTLHRVEKNASKFPLDYMSQRNNFLGLF